MTEIAPCPMPGCGGECVAQEAEARDIDLAFVTCLRCGYQASNEERCEEAILAHSALCADVENGRKWKPALAALIDWLNAQDTEVAALNLKRQLVKLGLVVIKHGGGDAA